MKPRMKVIIVLMVALAILLSACTNTKALKSDRIVPETKRIALRDGGPHQDIWKTRHLSISYEYQWKAKHLALSGTMKMAVSKTILEFNMKAHFVNTSGQIILSHTIIAIGGYQEINEIPFRMDLDLPKETQGVTFGYEGTYYNSLCCSHDDKRFRHTPF